MKEENELNPMKALRQNLKKTQQIFADEAGIGKSTVSHIESGMLGISASIQKKVAKRYHLYSDWYQSSNYKPKPSFREIEKMLWQYINQNIKDEQVASDIFIAIKEIINIKSLSGEEQKTYIRYIHEIMNDLKYIAKDAKSYIKKEFFFASVDNAQKIADDVISLFGFEVSENIELPGTVKFVETDMVEIKIDFS